MFFIAIFIVSLFFINAPMFAASADEADVPVSRKKSVVQSHLLAIEGQPAKAQAMRFVDGRPEEVRAEIDKAFNQLSRSTYSTWGHYNNGESGVPGTFYNLVGCDELRVLKHMVAQNPDQHAYWLMDVGAGGFGWLKAWTAMPSEEPGENLDEYYKKLGIDRKAMGINDMASKFLRVWLDEDMADRDPLEIHIVGVRGESYEGDALEVIQVGTHSIHLHRLGGVKVEDIKPALAQKGLPVDRGGFAFDMIVSSWCLTHLVDPFGTVSELHKMLRQDGFLFFDPFNFSIDFNEPSCVEDVSHFGYSFHTLQATHLLDSRFAYFHEHVGEGRKGMCVIQKSGEKPIPLAYDALLTHKAAGYIKTFCTCFKSTDGKSIESDPVSSQIPDRVFNNPTQEKYIFGEEGLVSLITGTFWDPFQQKLTESAPRHTFS